MNRVARNLLALLGIVALIALMGSWIHGQPGAPASPPGRAQVSLDGASLGMSQAEVVAHWGKPSRVNLNFARPGNSFVSWNSYNKSFWANLQNDRVEELSCFGAGLQVGQRSFPDKSSLDDLNNELGPAAAQDWNLAVRQVSYPRLHLKVRWDIHRQICGYTLHT